MSTKKTYKQTFAKQTIAFVKLTPLMFADIQSFMNAEDIYREVGQNIRRHREGAGRTQAQLAAQIGISRASLANIEAGRQKVLLHYLYAIADAMDLPSLSELMPELPPSPTAGIDAITLPLPQEGLSDKQRMEVLRLMGGVFNNNDRTRSVGDE